MGQPLTDEPMRSSVLDRLHQGNVPGRFAGRQTLGQLVQSVQRDLEQLLNTRYRVSSWPPSLAELSRSLVNYGLPDFAGANMSSQSEREAFCRAVEDAIRWHEPRFLRVRVSLKESRDRLDRTLRFHIEAVVRATPDPAEVRFDSAVDPQSTRIHVTAAR